MIDDCEQDGVCATPPGCQRHWSERNSELVSENAALTKRVAELEQRLRFTAESLRSLSPGPHPGPMDAEDYVPLIARLIESLESQLAWTPVSDGLPTEHADYEFAYCDSEQVSRLDLVRLTHEGFELVLSGDTFVAEELLDNVDYTDWRRIELPKEGDQ